MDGSVNLIGITMITLLEEKEMDKYDEKAQEYLDRQVEAKTPKVPPRPKEKKVKSEKE